MSEAVPKAVPKKPVQVISITAGKGGVGKTNIAVNLAIALAKLNNKVMLLDADLGLANVDVLLGLTVKKNIFHVLKGECQLADIQLEGPCGIKIIPAGSGVNKKVELDTFAYANLIRSFSLLTQDIDILIIDTAAGISQQVLHFLHASQEIIVIVCNEPTSLSDSYALIKLLHTRYNIARCRIIVNMVSMPNEGREVFMSLHDIAARFLNISLQYVGEIPQDIYMRVAIKNRHAVMTEFPGAKSSYAFTQIAKQITQWPAPTALEGRMAFFFDRFIKSEQLIREDIE